MFLIDTTISRLYLRVSLPQTSGIAAVVLLGGVIMCLFEALQFGTRSVYVLMLKLVRQVIDRLPNIIQLSSDKFARFPGLIEPSVAAQWTAQCIAHLEIVKKAYRIML